MLWYIDLLVAVNSSLRSNILYISRRRETGGKTSVSVNANVIGWSVMCPRYMIGAITVSGHGISCALFCEVYVRIFQFGCKPCRNLMSVTQQHGYREEDDCSVS
jgi:hypothetical protein